MPNILGLGDGEARHWPAQDGAVLAPPSGAGSGFLALLSEGDSATRTTAAFQVRKDRE